MQVLAVNHGQLLISEHAVRSDNPTAMGRIYDLEQNIIFPPQTVQSILKWTDWVTPKNKIDVDQIIKDLKPEWRD